MVALQLRGLPISLQVQHKAADLQAGVCNGAGQGELGVSCDAGFLGRCGIPVFWGGQVIGAVHCNATWAGD
jgi:hypothetical protein